MTWQEREYAREPDAPFFGGQPGRRGRGFSIVKALIIANVAMYVLCYMTPLGPTIRGSDPRVRQVVTPEGVRLVVESEPGLGEMITTAVLHGQVWRLVTSQYLHAPGMTHILFNMIGLLFLGQALEQVWSNRKFFVVYTLAGICGNLLLMAAGMLGWINPDLPALGASGCILGLLGAAAVMFPHAQVYIYFLFPIKIRTAAAVFALMYAYNVYSRGANYGGDLCHLAGLAFGAWYAWRGDALLSRVTLWNRLVGAGGSGGPWLRRPRVRLEPGAWARKMDRQFSNQEEVDRVLKKVYEGGIHTLTPQERQTLAEESERQREEDLRAKRGW